MNRYLVSLEFAAKFAVAALCVGFALGLVTSLVWRAAQVTRAQSEMYQSANAEN